MELEIDGTNIVFDIHGYKKDSLNYDEWCNVKLSVNNKYFKYDNLGELLESSEIDSVINTLKELINGKLNKKLLLTFAEPYIEFEFFPKNSIRKNYETKDILMDLILNLPNSEFDYNSESYIINFNRERLNTLLNYLTELAD